MLAAVRRPTRACLTGPVPRWWWREAATAAKRGGGAPAADQSATTQQSDQAAPEPAARSISVHKGLKIQAALCVERPPLEVLEPDFKRRWRAFSEAWERRTSNSLSLSDELIFMRFHFHFYGDEVATKAVARGGASSTGQLGAGRAGPAGRSRGPSAAASSTALATSGALAGMGAGGEVGLSSLISQEGINLQFPEAQKSGVKRKVVKERVREAAQDADMRSLLRLSSSSLFLLVRYGGGKDWTFPKADRVHGQGMQETLLRLCSRQLAPAPETPYMVGACPFAYRKRQGGRLPGVEGRKIFYYKAKWVPGSQLQPPQDGPVEDWAWCSRAELPLYLRPGEWHAVRHGVPLDHLA